MDVRLLEWRLIEKNNGTTQARKSPLAQRGVGEASSLCSLQKPRQTGTVRLPSRSPNRVVPSLHHIVNRALGVVSPPIGAFASKKMKGDITLPERALDL
jgi:hypothetical protein